MRFRIPSWSELRPPCPAGVEPQPMRVRLRRAARTRIGWLPLLVAVIALLLGLARLAELADHNLAAPGIRVETDTVLPATRSPSPLIDVNTASTAELATLPRISDNRARRIVEQRAQQPFRSLMDLVQRGLLRPTDLAPIAELAHVYVSAD